MERGVTMNYVVKPGETLVDIAAMFNTTVEELLMLNPQVCDPMCLFPGQVICVPSQHMPMQDSQMLMGAGAPCPVLRQGSQGPSVVHLQQLLTSHGFSPGNIDGIFGPRTEAAVIAFQQSRGLLVDGIVGVQTWTALGVNCGSTPPPPGQPCPTLRMGSRGAAVREVQQLLNSQGFNPGPIDGIFGPRTQNAVIAFQRSRGLVQDGIVGIKTWTALGVRCRN